MSEWEEAPLGELAETQLGKMLDQKKNQGSYRPYLGNDNVQWGYIDFTEIKQMRFKDDELKKFELHVGDLLVCEGGDPGRCALWISDQVVYYQKALHRVRVKKELDPVFLYFTLLHMGRTQEIRQYYTGGATIKHLPKAALNRVVIRYPQLTEQKRIAGILSAYDKLIENNRKQIKLLEEAAQRLYKEWFIDLKFPGHETTPIDSTTNLPEGWKSDCFLDVVDYVRGKSYSTENLIPSGTLKLVNLNNIHAWGGWSSGAEKPFEGPFKPEQLVSGGELIMSVTDMTKERRLVGHAARVPGYIRSGLISMDLIKLVPKKVETSYLYATLRFSGLSKMISFHANGTNVLHLKPDALSRVNMVVPNLEIQKHFSAIINPAFDKIDLLEEQITDAQEARDRLLPVLMNADGLNG